MSVCLFVSPEHDECLSGLHNCDENALCFNMVGGHSCSCKPGYTGNGTMCKGRQRFITKSTSGLKLIMEELEGYWWSEINKSVFYCENVE